MNQTNTESNKMKVEGFDPSVDPIVCSPYAEPDLHWQLDMAGRAMPGRAPLEGRRKSALIRPVPEDSKAGAMALNISTETLNRLINEIREKVGAWRMKGYPNTTSVTRKLLLHWADDQSHRQLRPFFAQREAIETLIWLREAATANDRKELEAASRKTNDGIVRYCAKMATGTGKTAVMGMLIAWQTLNAVRSSRKRDLKYSTRFLVLTPGLTVRDRLAVLRPNASDNVYAELGLVPRELLTDLSAARIEIVNFQAFRPRDPSNSSGAEKKLLGKKRIDQTETPKAMVRRVVGGLLRERGALGDIVVINDEAHHCYLPPSTSNDDDDAKDDPDASTETSRTSKKAKPIETAEEKSGNKIAAVWFSAIRTLRDIGALGKIDSNGGQASPVYDFSATPMWISRASRKYSPMFEWVASDFGLMDAIESGLVKVPRVPVDDDTKDSETTWRRLYDKTKPKQLPTLSADATAVLPQPLEGALRAAVKEWKRSFAAVKNHQPTPPPVMIVVANKISNAVALYEHIAGYQLPDRPPVAGRFEVFSNVEEPRDGGESRWRTSPRTLLVHSRLDDEDAISQQFEKLLKEQASHMGEDVPASAIREALNTVGKPGKLGEKVRCVISVSMLTEGWDARTVNQIVGFRKFSSQLLCEQVTGRALRRTSYESFRKVPGKEEPLLTPEYAEVIGIPFEFMPVRGEIMNGEPPKRTHIKTIRGRKQLRIHWPQVEDYLTVAARHGFRIDPKKVKPANVAEDASAAEVEMAGVSGKKITLYLDDWQREKAARVRCAAEIANLLTYDDWNMLAKQLPPPRRN